ncbi:hypothetical protein GJ699_26570 [Duganella sp. FT80W]|uniref:Calcineurin-like phosphoesterase domain-containing protein n=1 Tax=Duganella guangzhouensis TaxID=2666084 RepID=A0A6I2L5X3_9BURK|nr:metallophosphoesterase [Duganella guangzhouensis]MRW93561.1 hypothetical protein [Duganella guangzhouensis]
MKTAKILHLSDLHFGFKHDKQKWQAIVRHVKETHPALIVITGDVVNSPWWWDLRTARTRLTELKALLPADSVPTANKAATAGEAIKRVVYVPGNHDTRWSGLIDLIWLDLLGLMCFVLFFAALFFAPGSGDAAGWTHWLPAPWTAGLLLLLSVGFRLCFRSNLKAYFCDFMLAAPTAYGRYGVGIIPLDSTKGWAWGAQGSVARGIGNMLSESDVAKGAADIFWIAAVHHHPLPIPFDSNFEPVMIMNNAGTVLHELTYHKVPLILHGHKHHQHFSRLLVRIADKESQISVLSAGTPTHKKRPSPNRHSFNEIVVQDGRVANIQVFEANGDETFKGASPFTISANEGAHERSFDLNSSGRDLMAERLILTVSIDEFSHARYAEEFYQLRSKKTILELPYVFPLKRKLCEVDDIVIGTTASQNVSPSHTWNRERDGSSECKIEFHPQLSPPNQVKHIDSSVDFYVEYRATNFCALNSRQALEMRGNNSAMEELTYVVPDNIAVEELHVQINFPTGSALPNKLSLQRGHKASGGTDWDEPDSASMVTVHSVPMAFATINAPVPGDRYRINWEVQRVASAQNAHNELAYEKALLQAAPISEQRVEEYVKLVGLLAISAFEHFYPDTIKLYEAQGTDIAAVLQPAISVSIYAYDRQAKELQEVHVEGQSAGPGYLYGAGLVGLAFKNQTPVAYGAGLPKNHRYKATPLKDEPLEDQFDIEAGNEDTLAIPLYAADVAGETGRRAAGEPYGVVAIAFSSTLGALVLDGAQSAPRLTAYGLAASAMVRQFVKTHIL